MEATSWKPNFFRIWFGQAASDFTSLVLQFAIIWHLTDLTGSALVLSGAMMAGFLPNAILGPFAGVVIDRYSRRAVMIVSDLFVAGACAVLAIADTFGTVPVWLIMAVLVLRSVGGAFHQPCMQAVTPQIVPVDQLARCAGYSQSIQSLFKLISPGVAVIVYGAWGLNQIILLDILGAVVAVATLMVSRIPRLEHVDQVKRNVLRETIDGWKILSGNRGAFGLVLIGALYSAALMPVSALFPLMTMSWFGGSSAQAGLVEMLFSGGALAGALFMSVTGGAKNKVHTIVGATMLMSLCLLTTGLLPAGGLGVFTVIAFFMGICFPCFWGSQTAILQQSFPAQYMGRVMAVSGSIRVIASPISLSVGGLFAEKYGTPKWFIIAGIITLTAGTLCQAVSAIRNCDTLHIKHENE